MRLSRLLAAGVWGLVSFASIAAAAAQGRPPNVVIFLADDAGWGDYSRTAIQSADAEHRFARHAAACRWIASSSARCARRRGRSFSPGVITRARACAACRPARNAWTSDEKTLADAFKAAGYATGAFGKWHNGSQWPYHPMARGFDEFYGYTSGHWGEYFDPPLEQQRQAWCARRATSWMSSPTARCDFIERNKDAAVLLLRAVHHAAFAVGRAGEVLAALQGQAHHADAPPCRTGNARPDALRAGDAGKPGRQRRPHPAKLDELSLTENTIVIYFSRQRPELGRWNGGMKGKKGEHRRRRRALDVVHPLAGKLPAGRTVHRRSLARSICCPRSPSLAGIPRVGDKPLDGRDLSPLLLGRTATGPSA